jgi:hypothetical protein
MAATVTSFETTAGGGQTVTLYKIVETNVAAATEYNIVAPTFGTIVSFKAQLVSGTGATIKPVLGIAGGFTADTFEEIAEINTAAAFVNDITAIPYALGNAFVASPQNVGTMTIRSTPNSGTNNAVTTIIVIVHGMA